MPGVHGRVCLRGTIDRAFLRACRRAAARARSSSGHTLAWWCPATEGRSVVVCAVITRLDLVTKLAKHYAPSRFSGVRVVAAPRPRPLSLARDFIDASMCRASTMHSRGLGPPGPCSKWPAVVSCEPLRRLDDRRPLPPLPSLPAHSTHSPQVTTHPGKISWEGSTPEAPSQLHRVC